QGTRILRIRSFIRHHDTKPTNLCINDRPESVQGSSVTLHPPIINIMGTHRMLHWKEWGDLVVFQDHIAIRVEDKPNVKKAIFDLRVTRLRLSHNKGVILSGKLTEFVSFFARNINGAFSRELHMIEVVDFIIEGL